MLALKYLLVVLGIGIFGSAAALAVYDAYLAAQLRRLLRRPDGAQRRLARAVPRPRRILRVERPGSRAFAR